MQRRTLLQQTALTISAFSLGISEAKSNYPSRPVTLVVPFPPGGASDTYARALGRELATRLDQAFVVDNRSGATGLIGTAYVKRAKPDGHTLLVSSNSSQIIAPLLKSSASYDGVVDFEPIGMLGSYPLALQVGSDSQARTMADLIKQAKAQPGKLNFGSIGDGSVTHFAGELFKQKTGVDIVHVPYKGTGALTTALLAGEIDLMFDSVGAARPMVEAGRLRALAITGERRSRVLPDVPSMAEQGLPAVDVKVWIGAFAPKGTPADIVRRLSQEMSQVLITSAAVRKVFEDNGTDVIASSPEAFRAACQAERAQWQALIATLNLASK